MPCKNKKKRKNIMQDLLKDYLVEHIEEEKVYFSLTCAICGNQWHSTPMAPPALCSRDLDIAPICEEAGIHNRMCTFCGRPVCLGCFEDVEGIFLCTQCAKDLRARIEIK
jgi:hypothetical protein